METVAFYSYKGGVGRTLLVANTAQFLAMSGRKVVALDLDLEAPGLHQKLGSREVMGRAAEGSLRGAVDELLDILEKAPTERNSAITFEEVNLPTGTTGSLRLIPAGAAPAHNYWAALERLNWVLRTRSREGGLPEAVLELRARIRKELKPDFLLVDSRTGITELGGLATSLLADRVVCLTTTARESIDGTKVVAEALRKAPRLKSQNQLEPVFLITRVVSVDSPIVARVRNELSSLDGCSVTVLPHDDTIAEQEHLGWRQHLSVKWDHAEQEKLFSATLEWIEHFFRGHEDATKSARKASEGARRRMEVVHQAWRSLTDTDERLHGGFRSRAAWSPDQLGEGTTFFSVTKGGGSRRADIVVYENPIPYWGDVGTEEWPKEQMIVEYVENEDRDVVTHWWLANTDAKVAVVLSNQDGRTGGPPVRVVSRTHSSERWWNRFPLPNDFDALDDPADDSLDALLNAVHRCSHERLFHASLDYLDRIVTEWVHCSAVGLHGGVPWKPHIAKKIEDALVCVQDVDLARRVLHAAFADGRHRENWLSSEDDGLVEQVHAELFTPLLWRLPPQAFIGVIGDRKFSGLHGPTAGSIAIGLMARDMLGLRYDPDATFRVEGQRILDRSGWRSESDDDTALYPGLSEAFKLTEISFAISSDLPPLAGPISNQGEENEQRRRPMDPSRLVSERILQRSLIGTGLLGDYQPQIGRVVLYGAVIEQCADKLSLQPRHVGSVVLIHETLHALMHLGRDLDGRMWPEFALPDASSPLFEPSWFHETLTQYFTYQHILRLRDPALLHAFESISAKSMPQYRAWERIRNLPIEDGRSWLMSVRRGVPPHSLQMVIHGAQDMS